MSRSSGCSKSYRDEAALTTLGRITVRELIVSLLENLLRIEAERSRNPAHRAAAHRRARVHHRPASHGHHALARAHQPGSGEPRAAARGRSCIRRRPRSRRTTSSARALARPSAARLGRSARARVHAHPSDRAGLAAGMHRDHRAGLHEHPVPYDARRALVRGLARARLADARLRLSLIASCSTCRRRRPRRRAGCSKRRDICSRSKALLERYPDANIVQTHRDPLRVMASMASHATVLRRAFSDSADPRQDRRRLGRPLGASARQDFSRCAIARRRRSSSTSSFESIESDPLETVERVYDFLGWPLTTQRARRCRVFSPPIRRTSMACTATRSSSSA